MLTTFHMSAAESYFVNNYARGLMNLVRKTCLSTVIIIFTTESFHDMNSCKTIKYVGLYFY